MTTDSLEDRPAKLEAKAVVGLSASAEPAVSVGEEPEPALSDVGVCSMLSSPR
jgi:hypothetical protein